MRPRLTIAIDFDDTFTADPQFWAKFIETCRMYQHTIICVSARRNTIEHRHELRDLLPDGVPVLLSYDQPKRDYVAEHSEYKVDIWIDDRPEGIGVTS